MKKGKLVGILLLTLVLLMLFTGIMAVAASAGNLSFSFNTNTIVDFIHRVIDGIGAFMEKVFG